MADSVNRVFVLESDGSPVQSAIDENRLGRRATRGVETIRVVVYVSTDAVLALAAEVAALSPEAARCVRRLVAEAKRG